MNSGQANSIAIRLLNPPQQYPTQNMSVRAFQTTPHMQAVGGTADEIAHIGGIGSLRGAHNAQNAACAAGAMEPSHVLAAMGVENEWARGAVRLTLGIRSPFEDPRFPNGYDLGIAGSGDSDSVIAVEIPSVPSDPTRMLARLGSAPALAERPRLRRRAGPALRR